MTAFLQALLGLLLQSTSLLLLGLLAHWLTRKNGPAVQTLIGRATLSSVALLLMLAPLSGHVRPLWRIPTPQQAATLPKREGEPMVSRGNTLNSPEMSVQNMPVPTLSPAANELPINEETPYTQPSSPSRFGRVAACCGVGLWLAGSSILFLWLAVCQWHLTRLRRTASLIISGPAPTLLNKLTLRPPTLLTHPSVHSPFLAGLRRSAIFLPVDHETEFDTNSLRAILTHELAHRDRHDNAWTLLARLLTAMLWPQALLWLICRRLEQISEDACDEAVLASNCPPRVYADCLLTLAERRQPNHRQRTLTAGVAPFRSSLGRRVQHILSKGTRPMSTVSPRLRLTIAALTIAAALGGAFLVSSAPAQINQPSSPSTDQLSLSQAQLLAGLTPVQGPGVIVTLTDSKKPSPKGLPGWIAPPNIIHDTDINQVLNELKAAGAEAIAINGQRLVTTSAVRCAGRDVYVNNTPVLAPYIIKAIGEPKVLETALNVGGGIAAQIKQFDKTMFSDQKATTLTLPAYPVFSQAPLNQAQFLAGLTPVQGHGMIVTLNDSKTPFPGGLPNGMAPPNLIHDTDINQVVNELKAAGAEAVSVNDQRLVATSAVRNAGPTILINNTLQTPPYVIKAIGEPKTLEAALNISGGIASQIKQYDKAMFTDQGAAKLTLPAYTGTDKIRYAKPISSADVPAIENLTQPKRSFVVNFRAPAKGTHMVQVYTKDTTGRHLASEKNCGPGTDVHLPVTTFGRFVSFQIYDNGKLTQARQITDTPVVSAPNDALRGRDLAQQLRIAQKQALEEETTYAQINQQLAAVIHTAMPDSPTLMQVKALNLEKQIPESASKIAWWRSRKEYSLKSSDARNAARYGGYEAMASAHLRLETTEEDALFPKSATAHGALSPIHLLARKANDARATLVQKQAQVDVDAIMLKAMQYRQKPTRLQNRNMMTRA